MKTKKKIVKRKCPWCSKPTYPIKVRDRCVNCGFLQSMALQNTPKKKQPVKARKTTSNEIIWLECEHFCYDERSHVLLRWDGPSGPVYRTGYWHDAKLKYVGSGDVEFRTQPHYLSVLEPTTPVFVLPATQEAYDAMREQAHAAVVAEFNSKKGPPGLKDYSDAVLKSIGIPAGTSAGT